ncbi:MAG: hypothetical protein HGA19_11940 [Oscillochloris sp.]|nr:hypothetical protein [Oscillochloris sp.]
MVMMSMLPEMEMRVTPALLNLAQLLLLPSMDLQQLVQQELSENPALDEIETYEQSCTRCGSLVVEGICINCASADAVSDGPVRQEEEQIDPLLFVAAPRSLAESLLSDLYISIATEDHPIGLAIVGNLDEHGFLVEELEVIADQLGVPLERVQHVLTWLREVGPAGIATHDSQECMLAQIDALAAQGISNAYVRTVIAEYFTDLGSGRFKQIARQLRISTEEMDEVRHFIQRHLWPYPAQAALSDSAPLQRTRYRTADIAILTRDDTFMVEVLHSPRRVLRLNPLYQDLARQANSLPEGERQHVREYIARARVFLANLRQRESTLQRIGEAIVLRQEAFLRHGVRHLIPMTREAPVRPQSQPESSV